MERPPVEVADIFRAHGGSYRRAHQLAGVQLKAMAAIERCRTAALGGHLEECDRCGHQRNAYNSCGNRNCPKCQSSAARRWLQERESELVEVPYFHVVFTVPKEVAVLALGNPRVVYRILFECTSQTLLQIGADSKHLGGQLGFLCILHTWGQNLEYHPHIHCVVVGGSLRDGRWKSSGNRFLLPVKVLSAVFRGKILYALNRAFGRGDLKFAGALLSLSQANRFNSHLSTAAKKRWVVYCKPPFGGPQQVLQYLGRYTHRIAISNHRLVALNGDQVTFKWKDYRDSNRNKLMTLTAQEFIRRFLLHVVPSGFVRIRHYGLLSNRNRKVSIHLIRSQLSGASCMVASPAETPKTNSSERPSLSLCPACKSGTMIVIMTLPGPREINSS